LLCNKNLGSHIHHKCNYTWGEDCALRTLYKVVANNHIPPCFDIPMDPIRIWNRLMVYWIFDNIIVIINIISRDMNRTTLKTKHIWQIFFDDSYIPIIIN
jgi:hypothetical protein